MNDVLDLTTRSMWQRLSPEAKQAYVDSLSEDEADAFFHDWTVWARDAQLLPTDKDWAGWLVKAGRGFGKTRLAAEAVRAVVGTGRYGRIGICGRTATDAVETCINGDSGLLSIYPRSERPNFIKSRGPAGMVEFSNGAVAMLFSAEEPDALRGPQHHFFWFDELASYQYAQEIFDQVMFGLRLGDDPRWIGTTTPRPIALMRALVADSDVYVTNGSTYDNKANLAASALKRLEERYANSRLGRQELNGELLDDNPNALWNHHMIDDHRVSAPPPLMKVAVGVDPAVTNNANSDETGIVAAGIGIDGHLYVLSDATMSGKPTEWALAAIGEYNKLFANAIVGEVNQGGDLVEANIRACEGGASVAFFAVRATRGKALRAEPIATKYEQGKVHHVGFLADLETQLCDWDPTVNEKSPDRLDALVWVCTWLLEQAGQMVNVNFQATGARQSAALSASASHRRRDMGDGFGSIPSINDFTGY